MTKILIVIGALFMAPSAHAQLSVVPDLSADRAAIQNAQTTANAAVQAMPQPADIVGPTEAVGGAIGTSTRYKREDWVPARITRTVSFTTAANGTAAVVWPEMPSVPAVFPFPNIASNATQTPACFPVIGTITTTGATVKCMQTQTLLGLGLVPFTTAPAGVTGQVLAIPFTTAP